MTKTDFVILVNQQDEETGTCEKLQAHQQALLHRAFSILLFNDKGELLLQQRAMDKYHSAGLWTNCCCSHPAPGELTMDAAKRRLSEELYIPLSENVSLSPLAQFIYRVQLENQLVEHEYDHVFIGYYTHTPVVNVDEAIAYKWMDIQTIKKEIKESPAKFSFWFKEIISQFCDKIEQHIDESLQKRNI
jgi:isopentenyl-diphosphate delta-isomerase